MPRPPGRSPHETAGGGQARLWRLSATVVAAIRQAVIQPDRKNADDTWRHVADESRGRWPKLAALRDEAKEEVPAYMDFPLPTPDWLTRGLRPK